MIRAAAEHRETSENRRGQGREPRFFSSQIIPYYFAFPSLPHHSSNPYETPYNTLPQPHHPDSPPPTTTTTFPTILSLPPPPWSLSLLWFFWLFSVWVFMETWEASEFLGWILLGTLGIRIIHLFLVLLVSGFWIMDAYHHFDNSDAHLPPGFRFHPTDEELITYYLIKKVLDSNFTGRAIAEVDLNKCEPWELPGWYHLPTLLHFLSNTHTIH